MRAKPLPPLPGIHLSARSLHFGQEGDRDLGAPAQEFGRDLETVENMQGFGTFLTDDLQVGFPHV